MISANLAIITENKKFHGKLLESFAFAKQLC